MLTGRQIFVMPFATQPALMAFDQLTQGFNLGEIIAYDWHGRL
jgi:hypothetical protein